MPKKYPKLTPPERVPPELFNGAGYMVTVQHSKCETDYFTFKTKKHAEQFYNTAKIKYGE